MFGPSRLQRIGVGSSLKKALSHVVSRCLVDACAGQMLGQDPGQRKQRICRKAAPKGSHPERCCPIGELLGSARGAAAQGLRSDDQKPALEAKEHAAELKRSEAFCRSENMSGRLA